MGGDCKRSGSLTNKDNSVLNTFEKILTLHATTQVYSPEQALVRKRVFERLCAEQEVGNNAETRENMARIVLMASQVNVSENELYDLASKVVKRFPQM
jgi:hypothetical protein